MDWLKSNFKVHQIFVQEADEENRHDSISPLVSSSLPTYLFCDSHLMHDVQLASIFSDSKTFVDKKLKFTESEILRNYDTFKQEHVNTDDFHEKLADFVDENFEDGDELEEWVPPDFTLNPSIAKRIIDGEYRKWSLALNDVWKSLARKIKDDVKNNPQLYSLIWVPNGFCIPGGRFRELYYWDTYWIVNGLILCDMKQTARGIIENIFSLVNRFGFMPNGNRVYYLNRTQPPLLTLMVFNYFQATQDFNLIHNYIDTITTEFEYWLSNRMVRFEKDGQSYYMARYCVRSDGPRPESYREDYELGQAYSDVGERNNFYSKIKSATETGWDFSSRWFIKENGTQGTLSDVNTPSIIPVDLNAFLHVNSLALSTWWLKLGSESKSKKYREIGDELLRGIEEVMWREDVGTWFDWDMMNNKSRDQFYISNLTPLWTGSYTMSKKHVASKTIEYLVHIKILEDDHTIKYFGTPSSMQFTNEQWDYPNAWPPLQALIIQGLDRTNEKEAQKIAFRMAQSWLYTNYCGFQKHKTMFEKYNSLEVGETGAGGEYIPQTGFGWSNGVILEFLDRWGKHADHMNKNQNLDYFAKADFNIKLSMNKFKECFNKFWTKWKT